MPTQGRKQINDDQVVHVWSRQKGYVHAPFNTALLQTCLLAYPQSTVRFWADPSHLACVREQIEMHRDTCWERLVLTSLPLEGRLSVTSAINRLRWLFQATRQARRDKCQAVVFADMSNGLLFPLRLAVALRLRNTPVLVVAHAMFETLARSASWRCVASWWPTFPRNFRYVLLSDHIRHEVAKIVPSLLPVITVVDHPLVDPGEDERQLNGRTVFGFLGIAAKGLEPFADVAMEFKPKYPSLDFVYAGFAANDEQQARLGRLFTRLSRAPMSAAEYGTVLSGITYGVWLANHNTYRFRASGTIVELIMSQKPAIYLRNALVDRYFARFGDIGYRCESIDEVKGIISRIAESFPFDRYRVQKEHLSRARVAFMPSRAASSLVCIANGDSL